MSGELPEGSLVRRPLTRAREEWGLVRSLPPFEAPAPGRFLTTSKLHALPAPPPRGTSLGIQGGPPVRRILKVPLAVLSLAFAPSRCTSRSPSDGLLESTRLVRLRDAMEGAGYADTAFLSHLRGSGPHATGCWVIDGLTGEDDGCRNKVVGR